MQDSIQLPSSEQGQTIFQNHNEYPLSGIISPKGRRLIQNSNTNSNESLAYSNSTLHKNQLTDRQKSPSCFNFNNFINTNNNNFDTFNLNNQNINTLNFRAFDRFDKKQQTFGIKGLMERIQFQKIKEQSFQDKQDQSKISINQRIKLPCFLSYDNSPENAKKYEIKQIVTGNQNQQSENDSIEQTKSVKDYIKVNKNIVKDKINKKQLTYKRTTKTTQRQNQNLLHSRVRVGTSNSKDKSNQKVDNQRSRSPLSYVVNEKEIDKNNVICSLKQKVKQLEYSLKVESITSEQLRAKVNILNELLEQNFLQKNGINFKLFKNTSLYASKNNQIYKKQSNKQPNHHKMYQNIDLYVQMRLIEKSKQELQINFSRVKNQLDEKNKQLSESLKKCTQLNNLLNMKQRQQTKTQTSYLCGQSFFENKSPMKNSLLDSEQKYRHNQIIYQRCTQLQEQRQTLLQYIQSQKLVIQAKSKKIIELQHKNHVFSLESLQISTHMQLLQQKQKRFTQSQRPRLLGQIRQLSQRLDKKNEQIQRLEMQNNLIQLKLNNQYNISTDRKNKSNETVLNETMMQNNRLMIRLSPQKMIKAELMQDVFKNKNNIEVQQRCPELKKKQSQQTHIILQKIHNKMGKISPDALSLMMMQQQELSLLKNERDYFKQQYQKVKQLRNQNFILQFNNNNLSQQIQIYKRLIQQLQ